MPLTSIHVVIAIVWFFSLLSNIPRWTPHTSFNYSKDILLVYSLGLLQIKLLWIVRYRFLCECKFYFSGSKCPGVDSWVFLQNFKRLILLCGQWTVEDQTGSRETIFQIVTLSKYNPVSLLLSVFHRGKSKIHCLLKAHQDLQPPLPSDLIPSVLSLPLSLTGLEQAPEVLPQDSYSQCSFCLKCSFPRCLPTPYLTSFQTLLQCVPFSEVLTNHLFTIATQPPSPTLPISLPIQHLSLSVTL